MSKVNIEIDGQKLQVSQGSMVIEAADAVGISIPRFCYHKKLSVAANCRMCLVQVENAPKPLPACATPVSEGMKVLTQSKIAKDAQKSVMEFLLINHPLDCPICDQGGQCELQDVALEYGKDVSRFTEGKRAVQDKDIGPLIETEMTRCIHCTRCVRFGQELAGIRELGATGRGEHMTIGTFIERSVDSEVSGNVIDLCPVGALTAKPSRFSARAWEIKSRASVAMHDALGSHVFHHVKYNTVLKTVPRECEALNETWLSDRDRFGYEGFSHQDRITEPEIKIDGTWQQVSWEEALKATSERLQRLFTQYDANQIGALAGGHCTTEEYYLLAKIMRQLGSHNLDYRPYLTCPDLKDTYHTAWNLPFAKLEQQQKILLIGHHPRTEMPLLNMRLLKAHQHGSEIYGVQAYSQAAPYPMAQEVLVNKGDFASALAAIAKVICEKTKTDAGSLKPILEHAKASDETSQLAQSLVCEQAAVIMGEMIHTHPQANLLMALSALIAKALGGELQDCAPGSNASGAKLAGFSPDLDACGKAQTESGLNALQMLQDPLKGLILLNLEPEDTSHPALCLDTLKKTEEVIAITPFVTEQMREYADILLPMVPVNETDGTSVNLFGQLQSFRAVNNPQGQARPAWKIFRVLGNFLHLEGYQYTTCHEVMDELQAGFEKDDLKESKTQSLLQQNISVAQMPTASLIRIGQRGMYQYDNVLRRATALQKTQESLGGRLIKLHPSTARKLDLKQEDKVRVTQDLMTSSHEFELSFDPAVPKDSVLMLTGFEDRNDLGALYSPIELEKLT